MKAKFQCCKCTFKFEGDPRDSHGGCIKCEHVYVKWVNYEAWRQAHSLTKATSRKS